MEKQAANFYFKFLPETNLSHYTLFGTDEIKNRPACLSLSIPFLFGAETKVIQNHIARFS